MDVALHKLPVTVTLDRAGVTGPDGASHNGMWDGSILQVVPGLRVAAPRDGSRIAELLNEAVEVSDGPTRASAGPRAPSASRPRRSASSAQMDVLAVPGRRRGRGRAAARRRPDGGHLRRGRRTACRTTASASPSSTRAGSSRSTRRSSRPPGSTGWSRWSRTTAGPAGSATRWRGCCATTTSTSRSRRSASPQEFLDPRRPRADPRGGRADPAAPGAPADRGGRPPHAGGAAGRAPQADAARRRSSHRRRSAYPSSFSISCFA